MFGLGIHELLIILLVALCLFGVGKLPQVGYGLGKSLRDFTKAIRGIHDEVDEVKKV